MGQVTHLPSNPLVGVLDRKRSGEPADVHDERDGRQVPRLEVQRVLEVERYVDLGDVHVEPGGHVGGGGLVEDGASQPVAGTQANDGLLLPMATRLRRRGDVLLALDPLHSGGGRLSDSHVEEQREQGTDGDGDQDNFLEENRVDYVN